MLAGAGLAFARAVGEFGSVVLISGNLPFKTEVASSWIFGLSQSDDLAGASAVSIVLVAIALLVLLGHRLGPPPLRRPGDGVKGSPLAAAAALRACSATWPCSSSCPSARSSTAP